MDYTEQLSFGPLAAVPEGQMFAQGFCGKASITVNVNLAKHKQFLSEIRPTNK
jgi:hypothetical protein